jgi:transcriptional regulator with XRE-family HTH domain
VLAIQISELRDRQNKSQQELANMLGVTQSTITRIESGKRAITVAEVFKIAAALDCAPVYLLSGGLTGEDIPVTPDLRLASGAAHDWIGGGLVLPGGDEHAYMQINVSAEQARANLAVIKNARIMGVRAQATGEGKVGEVDAG